MEAVPVPVVPSLQAHQLGLLDFWPAMLLLACGLVLYLIPALVAYRRRHPNAAAIVLLNVLLGWTVLGWAAALVWAATAIAKESR